MMMLMLTTKAGDRVFDWRSRMAQTAMNALDKFFKLEDVDPEVIAQMAEEMIGPDEKISPFYYREVSDGTGPGKVRYGTSTDVVSREYFRIG
jgi:hypothetical protein